MFKTIILAATAVIGISTASTAEESALSKLPWANAPNNEYFLTENRLAEQCHGADLGTVSACIGYIIGAVEALHFNGICLPEHMPARDVVHFVIDQLDEVRKVDP